MCVTRSFVSSERKKKKRGNSSTKEKLACETFNLKKTTFSIVKRKRESRRAGRERRKQRNLEKEEETSNIGNVSDRTMTRGNGPIGFLHSKIISPIPHSGGWSDGDLLFFFFWFPLVGTIEWEKTSGNLRGETD